jgi:transcriptional regulator with XRE-family HTH domain
VPASAAICWNYFRADMTRDAATLASDMTRMPEADAPLTQRLPALMREHAITCRAFAAKPQSLDRAGSGLSYSHIANLVAGRELPSRRALELLATAFGLPASYFPEYRLAEFRR